MIDYPFNSDLMCKEYLDMFSELVSKKNDLLEIRNLKRRSNKIFQNIYLIVRKISEIFSN